MEEACLISQMEDGYAHNARTTTSVGESSVTGVTRSKLSKTLMENLSTYSRKVIQSLQAISLKRLEI